MVGLEALFFGRRAPERGIEDSDGSAGAGNSPRGDNWGLRPPSAVGVTAVRTRAMCRPLRAGAGALGFRAGRGLAHVTPSFSKKAEPRSPSCKKHLLELS